MRTVFLMMVFFGQPMFSQTLTTSASKQNEITNIQEALKEPEKVFRLNLSNQDIKISNEDWSKFINLEYLNLKNDHLKEIPLAITKIKSLKTIDLSGNDFTNLPESFSNLTNLALVSSLDPSAFIVLTLIRTAVSTSETRHSTVASTSIMTLSALAASMRFNSLV